MDVTVALCHKKQDGGEKHLVQSVKIDPGGEKLQTDGNRTGQKPVKIRQIDHLGNFPGTLKKEIDGAFGK